MEFCGSSLVKKLGPKMIETMADYAKDWAQVCILRIINFKLAFLLFIT